MNGNYEGQFLNQRLCGDTQLHTNLWIQGMMQEIRRYSNEVPTQDTTPPSMVIPFGSGNERVEFGYRAGMSCIEKAPDNTIVLSNIDHFPACTILVLISLWFNAYNPRKQNYKCRLQIPDRDSSEQFLDYLSQVCRHLPFLELDIITGAPYKHVIPEKRIVQRGVGQFIVSSVQQFDVGRFIIMGEVRIGSISVRDNITITDGNLNVIREHCPILHIGKGSGTQEQEMETAIADDSTWNLFVAAWFPQDMTINGMYLIKEGGSRPFEPVKLREDVVITL